MTEKGCFTAMGRVVVFGTMVHILLGRTARERNG
jgi:hypothetical protein